MDWIDMAEDSDMWRVVGKAMKMGWGYFLDQLRTC